MCVLLVQCVLCFLGALSENSFRSGHQTNPRPELILCCTNQMAVLPGHSSLCTDLKFSFLATAPCVQIKRRACLATPSCGAVQTWNFPVCPPIHVCRPKGVPARCFPCVRALPQNSVSDNVAQTESLAILRATKTLASTVSLSKTGRRVFFQPRTFF